MKHHIHHEQPPLPRSVKIIFGMVIVSNIIAAFFILNSF